MTAETLWNTVYSAALATQPRLAAWMERKRDKVWPLFVGAAQQISADDSTSDEHPLVNLRPGARFRLGKSAKIYTVVEALPEVDYTVRKLALLEGRKAPVLVEMPPGSAIRVYAWDGAKGGKLGDYYSDQFILLSSSDVSTVGRTMPAHFPDDVSDVLQPAQQAEFIEAVSRYGNVPVQELWESAKVYRAEHQALPWKLAFEYAGEELDPGGDVLPWVENADEDKQISPLTFRFEHSPETGTILYPPSARLPEDAFSAVRSQLGMNWSRREGFFYRAISRGKRKPTIAPHLVAKRLGNLGYIVAMDYDPRSPATIERALEAKRAYQEGRAERFAGRAGKHAAMRDAYHEKADQLSERFWGGQPILVGHHSEKKARRDQERVWADTRKSVEHHKAATALESKARSAERAAERAAPQTQLKTRRGPGPSQAKNEWVAELADLIARKLKKLTGATKIKRGYFGDTISFEVGFGAKTNTYAGAERVYQVFANKDSLSIHKGVSMIRAKADWELKLTGESPEAALDLLVGGFRALGEDVPAALAPKRGPTFTIPVQPGSAREGVLEVYGRLRVDEMPEEFDPEDPDDADALLVASYLGPDRWKDGKLTLPLDANVIQAFMRWTDYATSVNEEEAERTKDLEVKKDARRMAKAAETLSGVFLEALRKLQSRRSVLAGPIQNPRHQTSAALSPPQRMLLEDLGPDYIPEFTIPVPKRLQDKYGAAPHYTGDLVCPRRRHIVEVDGAGHGGPTDRIRDRVLGELGWKVDRVTNQAVYGAVQNPGIRPGGMTKPAGSWIYYKNADGDTLFKDDLDALPLTGAGKKAREVMQKFEQYSFGDSRDLDATNGIYELRFDWAKVPYRIIYARRGDVLLACLVLSGKQGSGSNIQRAAEQALKYAKDWERRKCPR